MPYSNRSSEVARFRADEPGSCKIELTGELIFSFPLNARGRTTHRYVMTVAAAGESLGPGGCAVGGRGASVGSLFVLLLVLGGCIGRRANG
jgi:hypothetical protein